MEFTSVVYAHFLFILKCACVFVSFIIVRIDIIYIEALHHKDNTQG